MLVRQLVRSGGLQRGIQPGDLPANATLPVTRNNNSGVTLTAQEILSGYIKRTGTAGGGISDTFPTADALAAALLPAGDSPNQESLKGLGFELMFSNAVGQTVTLAAPASSGVSISTAASATSTVATGKVRHLLIRLLSEIVRASTRPATGANAGTTLTFATALQPGVVVEGMAVYGTGIGSGAIVAGVIHGPNGITGVRLSAANTADITAGSITFTPRYEILSLGALDA